MYNCAIIGLGNAAWKIDQDKRRKEIWTHTKAYINHPNTNLVAVCDIDSDKQKEFSEKYPEIPTYSTVGDMFKANKIDIVSVCTPYTTHYDILLDVVQYETKAVFCEKPFCGDVQKAAHIISLYEELNIPLAVNYMRRWDNLYLKVKEAIIKGRFGKLKCIVGLTNTAFYTSSSHMVDMMTMLAGKLSLVYCSIDNHNKRIVNGIEEYGGNLLLESKSGVQCFVYANNIPENLLFEVKVIMENGIIEIKQDGSAVYSYRFIPSNKRTNYREPLQLDNFWYKPNERMLDAVTNIINRIEWGEQLKCSGEDALGVLEILDSMEVK